MSTANVFHISTALVFCAASPYQQHRLKQARQGVISTLTSIALPTTSSQGGIILTITSPRYISVPNKRRYHAFLEDTKLECPCGCNTRLEEQERTMWDKSKKYVTEGKKKKSTGVTLLLAQQPLTPTVSRVRDLAK